ncbi:MAG: M20/M25/M40 family metallo-hydrolase, partial [Syntrophomonadaceae bacterium]|nr:M20/M25/M40 family metallo-hydrolase [Syntrophomonadaceae bacterium]
GLANGPVMAANEEFEITILGKPGHTSAPQEGVDPIIIASTIIQTLQSIQTRETDVLTPTSIVFGRIKGGTARNIVTEKVEMGGTIRFLYENEESGKKELLGKVERLVKGICAAMRAEYEIKFIPSNPAVMNHPEIVELVRVSVKETYGNEGTIVPYMCMGGDDFAYFTQKVPSTYCFLGIGSKDKGSNYPHHHPRFDIDEDILAYGTEVHIRTALRFLNR